MNEEPEGFRVPIHRSLTESLKMGGIPRNIAIGNGFMTIALVMGAHNLWVLPLGFLAHVVLAMLYRYDPHILSITKINLSRPPHLRS
ncbi:MAG: VirB3 family type IV secretion system protein [Myxococcales bacterium]|nr:VirB3 family type IV secretion system protein [Myxococcales bacterium]